MRRAPVTAALSLASLAAVSAVAPRGSRAQEDGAGEARSAGGVTSGGVTSGGVAGGAVSASEVFASGGVSVAAILDALAAARPDNYRPVGTSSVTFRLLLEGPIDAAFKPESHMHPRGWLSEVAAYRVARLVGLDSVPPAVTRSFDRDIMVRRLDPEWGGSIAGVLERIVVTGTRVRGAAIYWVPDLEAESDLDTPAGLARWSAWLAPGAPIPADARALARDLATMAAFDYVIGNADRMSGGNVRLVRRREGARLVIRDHNLAFPARPNDAQEERMRSVLTRARRFPRGFLERLAALDEAALGAALAHDTLGPLLDDAQIAGVLSRRDTVLSWVGSLIEAHGEAAVLDLD